MTPLTPPPAPQSAIFLGWVRGTNQPFFLPVDALTRGVHLRGAIGAGKTSVIRRLLVGRGIESPFVHFDYIGTGHRELQAWTATVATARAVAEHSCPELHGITAAFLRRERRANRMRRSCFSSTPRSRLRFPRRSRTPLRPRSIERTGHASARPVRHRDYE